VGGGESYCLDPTHPGAAEWLRDVFGRLRDWGVRYVKLDFLRALLVPDPALPEDGFDAPRRYAGARTRVEAYRAGLALVRDALGPDATIVACSAPAAAGVGLVSAHRVGPDIEPRWSGRLSGVRDAARALAANWFWNGRTWANDPDYLVPCESEVTTRFWATVVAMSGGAVVISADLARLPDWAEELLAFPAPPIGRAARPIDLFANGPEPRVWHLPLARDGATWHLVAALNWREHATEERLSLPDFGLDGEVHVWDAWRRAHVRARGTHEVPLTRHDAALLCLRPVRPHPQLVGTDVHASQGWIELACERWDADAATLTLAVSAELPRPGTAWVWAPAGWRLADGAAPDSTEPDGSALYRVPLARGVEHRLRFRAAA
jgi:alpha-galactosidase